MNQRDVSQCQHKRLLERTYDHEGKKTENIMKCCECGTLVPKPSSWKMLAQ